MNWLFAFLPNSLAGREHNYYFFNKIPCKIDHLYQEFLFHYIILEDVEEQALEGESTHLGLHPSFASDI